MFIINRSGQQESVRYDKITDRNIELATDLDVDVYKLSQDVIKGLKSGMTTAEIDILSAETAAYLSGKNPDYDILATRISISNLHKSTNPNLLETYSLIKKNNETLFSDEMLEYVTENHLELQKAIDYRKDYNYHYFGFKTLEAGYLIKIDGKIVERPQQMLMRVALQNYGRLDLQKVIECYKEMSKGMFTHASPTMFNSCSKKPQLSSCFLLTLEDSLHGIYSSLYRAAHISKHAGGIGFNISKIRAAGSEIKGTNGKSDGIVPMLRVFNATCRYVNQGGRRKGAFCAYIELHHPDIFDFLDLSLKTATDEERRTRDMFLALWICDLFMKRVKEDGVWSLFCPNTVKELHDTYGEEFERIYLKAEEDKKYVKQIRARDLWEVIIHRQIETGMPYTLYKDSINKKSNQSNIGIIRCSNLCAEIVEYSDDDSIAVCNLASIALPKFVKSTTTFDFHELGRITEMVVENLNNIIDRNYYPIPEARDNNLKHRPIGIGVQGLADVFALMKIEWGDEKSRYLNRAIFETIYYHAVKKSHELALRDGSYASFEGSPISQGKLQYHLWNDKPWSISDDSEKRKNALVSWDWESLEEKVKSGMINSLLIALMPTATSSNILGNNECFEPFTSNLYTRTVLAGDFIQVNRHLYRDLKKLGLWTNEIVSKITCNEGSIQSITEIPEDIRRLYKTVWEIPQRIVIDLAADRAPFIDQTQSMNIHFENPTKADMTKMHFYGWEKGLKTGSYYLRTKPAVSAVKFAVMKKPEREECLYSCSA
jgi:ribonucleoside-diphosphate reductase alpha subunit